MWLRRYITSHDQPTGWDLVYSLIDNLYTDFCKRLGRRPSWARVPQELPLSWRHTLSMELRFYWFTPISCLQFWSRFRSRFPSQKPRKTFHVVGDINFFSSLCANVGPVICFLVLFPLDLPHEVVDDRGRRDSSSLPPWVHDFLDFPIVSLYFIPWTNSWLICKPH